jgi:hypothetical protein
MERAVSSTRCRYARHRARPPWVITSYEMRVWAAMVWASRAFLRRPFFGNSEVVRRVLLLQYFVIDVVYGLK